MKLRYSAGLLSLLLCACASPPVWTHPFKNEQDFNADMYDCQHEAAAYIQNSGFGNNPLMVGDETRRCMQVKKGWTPHKQMP